MGHTVSEETKNKKSWDSNAITPGLCDRSRAENVPCLTHFIIFLGTPFMDLLASSLKYWVVQKMNSDPAWKTVRSISSLRLSYLSS